MSVKFNVIQRNNPLKRTDPKKAMLLLKATAKLPLSN